LATKVTTTADPFASGVPRRIKVTCRYCGKPQETWTRRGLRFTCRNAKCGRTQEGPAAIQRILDRQQPPKAVVATATTIRIVSDHKPVVKPPEKPAPSLAAASKAQPKPPAPVAPPPPPRKDLLSRALGF
jgi:hypothetical protein